MGADLVMFAYDKACDADLSTAELPRHFDLADRTLKEFTGEFDCLMLYFL